MKTKSPARAIPHSLSGPARRQGGYMLLEVVIGIAIASSLIGAFYQVSSTIAENKRLASTERGITLISEALYNYRMQERKWPTSIADLSAYAPNMSAGLTNGFGQPYTLALTAADTDPIAPITVSTHLPSEEIAENVMREFYGRGTRTGTQVSVEIPIPGHEPAREALLARDGTREMQGDLNMDSHLIEDALRVEATELIHSNQQVTAGSVIAAPRIIAKNRLSIQQGTEETNLYYSNLATLNDLSRLNCSSNERVTVSGGVASCSALPDPPAPSAGSAGGACSGAGAGDCRCPGDLQCGISGSSGGCYCSCANQCGA